MSDDREDLSVELLGRKLRLTGKRMRGGDEDRLRIKFPSNVSMHYTEAVRGSWQEGHYHRGLTEVYVVVRGIMFMSCIRYDRRYINRHEEARSHVVTVRTEEAHNIFLTGGSAMVTITYGDPVGNPNRDGNDWWPARESFDAGIQEITEAWLLNPERK